MLIPALALRSGIAGSGFMERGQGFEKRVGGHTMSETSEQARLAVLETRMDNFEKKFADSDFRIAKSMEGIERSMSGIEKLLTEHSVDLVLLNEDRANIKNLYKTLTAAFISAAMGPVLIGIAFWFLFGQKILAIVTTNKP